MKYKIIPKDDRYFVTRGSWWWTEYLAAKFTRGSEKAPDFMFVGHDYSTAFFGSPESAENAIKESIWLAGIQEAHIRTRAKLEKSRSTITIPPWTTSRT